MKRFLSFFAAFFLFGFSNLFAGTYSGGSGTDADPYLISNLDDLKELCQTTADWSATFSQTTDIDASQTQYWDDADENTNSNKYDDPNDATDTGNNEGFPPIGNNTTKFTGEYRGNGHKISGLHINRGSTDYIGFFGYIDGASISYLGLIEVDISGDDRVGGFAAFNSSSTITNSSSSGTVSGDGTVGGFAGENASSGRISNCYSTCEVSGDDDVAGFAGENSASGSIDKCYSAGGVSGNDDTGGFCSYNAGTVSNCFWDTQASGQSASDGGTGKTTAEMKDLDIYTAASWDFDDTWIMDININNGYPAFWNGYENSYLPVDSDADTYINITNIGALRWVSESSSSWSKNYEQDNDINAKTTRGWNSGAGFLPIGDNSNKFIGEYRGNGHEISNLYIDRDGTDYIGFFGYFGYNNSSTVSDLGLVDVDITGQNHVGGLIGWCFESCTVSGCYSSGTVTSTGDNNNESNVGGLIGYCSSNCIISGCYSSATVTGVNYVGGLIGACSSNCIISGCYSSGAVRGRGSVGGFIGRLFSQYNSVSRCYSSGNVTGSIGEAGVLVGGFVGDIFNSNTISNCYSLGDVTRSQGDGVSYGGFCGNIDGHASGSTIEKCYSTGSVFYNGVGDPTDKGFSGGDGVNVTFNYNFFDSDASNQTSATGAAHKTTAEMKNSSTFTNWDFTPGSGTWTIQSGAYISYPYLQVLTYDTPGAVPEVNPIPGLQKVAPTVTTQAVSNIGTAAATGNGNITATGGQNCTERGIIFWAYTGGDKEIGGGGVTKVDETTGGPFGTGAFTGNLTGLSSGGYPYSARAYAINPNGTGYGARVEFWTDPSVPPAPEISRPTASSLSVAVDGSGNHESAEYLIKESSGSFVQADGTLGTGEVWRTQSQWNGVTVSGLSPNTQYGFSCKARNGNNVESDYGASSSSWTLPATPGAHPSPFQMMGAQNNPPKIVLFFQAINQIANCEGYLLAFNECNPVTGAPNNFQKYNAGDNLPNGTGKVKTLITDNSITYIEITTDITSGKNYYFKIFPYNWDGSNDDSYIYKTDGSPAWTIGNTNNHDMDLERNFVYVQTTELSQALRNIYINNQQNSVFVVPDGSSCTMEAGESIKIMPGFRAYNGSSFLAKITGCGQFSARRALAEEQPNPIKGLPPSAEEEDVIIYPNPNEGIFTIETNFGEDEPCSIEIYNSLSERLQHIKDIKSRTQIINLQNTAPGMYFLKIVKNNQVKVRKVLVK